MKTLVAIAVFLFTVLTICNYGNPTTITATVTGKERIHNGSQGFYLVFTDKGEFKIEDQLFYGKFNSSEMYGKLKEDHTYTFELRGYRNGFLSMYPNIKSYRE